ncbi:MAG TPA: glycosyltransferase, exosortase A system-associated [Woeseiaceae bacterium]|nr:glycosyltransferase, exosortase A system-associated [Woeseiaceae bacterium]
MKILHVLDHSLPLHSGYTFRSKSIINAQQSFGWVPVAVTSPKHEANWPNATEPEEIIDGIRFIRSGAVPDCASPLLEIRMVRRLYKRICAAIEAEKPDILHAHSPVLNGLAALCAGRRFGLPVVYEIRAFWEDAAVSHGSYGANTARYKAVAAAETFVCRRVSQVAVLCDGLKEDLIRRGIDKEKITPVPNAADLESFGDCQPATRLAAEWALEGKQVIGFIGSFYDYEGLDLLVSAFAELVQSLPNLVLLLVGGGRMEQQIKEQVTGLGLHERVVFAGRIPHQQVPGVYKLMQLAVFPRYSMRLTELVTPLKPLEAMAMRTACLASDIGGHRELIKRNETGFLFPPGDTDALAQAIGDLLSSPDMLTCVTDRAHDWIVRERNWTATNARYVEIYARAMSAPAAA